jgi:parallel beta-helix repeat protein
MNIPLMKLGLASAIAIAAVGMTGCGGNDSDSTDVPDIAADGTINDKFNCTDVSTTGSRVICIGAADDLTDATIAEELVTALSTAQTGDTIVLPQGRFNIATELTFDGNGSLGQDEMVTGLTIQGAGMDKTILDFDAATGKAAAKADGFFISNTNDIILEDFGVYEAPNNAIKIKKANGIIMRRLATVWETDYQDTNGAYGLYPVETQNVLIEDSFVKGSADAGVYVGQSSNIVVRNNIAEKNVAGIEIENSTNADVYGNTAIGNTGGILIFDLPIGNGLYGSGVRIFDNKVIENNAKNFAVQGTFAGGVHIVPPGTGVIVLSTSDVEIFDNTITDHKTMAVAVTSYGMPDAEVFAAPQNPPQYADFTKPADHADNNGKIYSYGDIAPYFTTYVDGWSPLVRSINIHDNTIVNDPTVYAPEGSLISDVILGYTFAGHQVPDVLYDGIGEGMAQASGSGTGLTDIMNGYNAVAAGLAQTIEGTALVLDGMDTPETDAQAALIREIAAKSHVVGLNKIPADTEGGDIAAAVSTAINTEYGAYLAADYVCVSNNGDTNQSSVFPTNPANWTFDMAPPTPDPVFSASDESMTCGAGKVPYVGAAATVTVAGSAYGCGADDKTSKHCVPAAE